MLTITRFIRYRDERISVDTTLLDQPRARHRFPRDRLSTEYLLVRNAADPGPLAFTAFLRFLKDITSVDSRVHRNLLRLFYSIPGDKISSL